MHPVIQKDAYWWWKGGWCVGDDNRWCVNPMVSILYRGQKWSSIATAYNNRQNFQFMAVHCNINFTLPHTLALSFIVSQTQTTTYLAPPYSSAATTTAATSTTAANVIARHMIVKNTTTHIPCSQWLRQVCGSPNSSGAFAVLVVF